MWELPQLAEFLETLGTIARVIVYDPRGYGASDPLTTTDGAAGLESTAEDLLAVLDEVRSDSASMFDLAGTGASVFLAATYPDRVRSIIFNHFAPSLPQLRGFTNEQ